MHQSHGSAHGHGHNSLYGYDYGGGQERECGRDYEYGSEPWEYLPKKWPEYLN